MSLQRLETTVVWADARPGVRREKRGAGRQTRAWAGAGAARAGIFTHLVTRTRPRKCALNLCKGCREDTSTRVLGSEGRFYPERFDERLYFSRRIRSTCSLDRRALVPLPDLSSSFIQPRALKRSTLPTVLVDPAARRAANLTRAISGLMQRRTLVLCPSSTCLFVKECALFARTQTEVHCEATVSARPCAYSNLTDGVIVGSSSAARGAQLRHSSTARKVLLLTPKRIIARMQKGNVFEFARRRARAL